MPRPSSIEVLPPDILEKLQALLRDRRVSQLEVVARINDLLADRGEKPLSKSALNRYAVKMDKAGEKLRQSRDISEMWIAKLGNAPQGKTGQLINELTRTMIFDVNLQLMEKMEAGEDVDLEATMSVLKDVALSVARLEKAASLNEDREKKIRDDERARLTDEATKFVRDQGLSVSQESELRNFLMQVS
ncbi:DUF3486 family protein [Mariprofundus ferrooxydans]|uniref:Mu-like phage gp27 n=1 Tax=Mariprofundus ferrooxydans PV-1 TaxID=314345 RepID=Q0EWD2_9PROT|nr:DUF3486 family protein [Mariprofundus ferrooxydans]EAU53539.1 Mu-like phage gp27 [Mariprofundus ferrooxydans PV-1]KON47011.1 hypothetical protein AL013_10495 [Mariprofundus ferrooxydans]